MALKVPDAFLSDTRRVAPPEEERLYRLPANHVQDLRDVARGVEESDAGVCCSYLVDSMSGEGSDFDEHALNALERFAEQSLSFEFLAEMFGAAVVSHWRARVSRCRRALDRLRRAGEHGNACVLFVAHGYPDPLVRQIPELADLGPLLGSLARYTNATEERRLELVRAESARSSRAPGTVPEDAVSGERWAALYDLVHMREVRASVDRILSSSDALRAALAVFPEPEPVPGFVLAGDAPADGEGPRLRRKESAREFEARKASRKERQTAHRDRRDAFVTAVRIDAAKMLSRAEKAYHEAWLRSAERGETGSFSGRFSSRFSRSTPIVPPARVRGAGWGST